MGIWQFEYNRLGTKVSDSTYIESLWLKVRNTKKCIYCNCELKDIYHHSPTDFGEFNDFIQPFNNERLYKQGTSEINFRPQRTHARTFEHYLKICPCCGWWLGFRNDINSSTLRTWGGVGGLKELDLADIDLPLVEVRQYLMADYKKRFILHPQKLEKVVGDVFNDLGYKVRVTAYSGDDGIDVILDGDNDTLIGVQVKRYKDKISINQIRELTGALVINGFTKGIFVTTSDFQSGAERTVRMSEVKGYPIELYNAQRFFEALKLAQINNFNSSEYQIPHLVVIGEVNKG